MGREVKRVALDFEWPINKIWTGYKISLCQATEEDCEECRLFANTIGLPITSYDCPMIPSLEPPSGEGYQLWETVSEGSPMSPVFATPEELAQWLTDNKASTFGYQTTTYENWLKFIKGSGSAMTMILDMNKNTLMSGVDFIASRTEEE